jgi:predicted Fe-Mo cluster-binding NifX family protein
VRVAVSASTGTLDGEVDPRFGRARFFLVVDGEGGLVEVIDNHGSDDLPHGAGVAAVEKMVRHGVTAVLTGRVGPQAEQGLRAAGIAVHIGISGRCRDAVAAFLARSGA